LTSKKEIEDPSVRGTGRLPTRGSNLKSKKKLALQSGNKNKKKTMITFPKREIESNPEIKKNERAQSGKLQHQPQETGKTPTSGEKKGKVQKRIWLN